LLQSKIEELEQSGMKLVEQSKQRLQERLELENCIKELTEKTGDLIDKAKRVVQLNQDLVELEEKKKRRDSESRSFLGVVALVCERPLKGLEMFSEVLPLLIENVKKGEYKAITVRNHTVQTLTGTTFELPMCCACPHIVVQPIPRPEIFVPTSSLTSLAASLLHDRLAPPVEKPVVPMPIQYRKIKIIAIEPPLLVLPGTPSTASEESPAG